uniref:Aminoacyl-histidine dipeptidase n=1 Tax=Spumella elongata TaxID=89044 RepID=A0A7S3HPJ9_9STRA|mmetsp:Transcript_6245/g.10494  ORF Transcript_6245/g.10494 Transcript_6245/m.10494 type:complete len:133 (+) Transcript_6245:3-401(+)
MSVLLSPRSSIGCALEAARDRLQAVADLAGGSLKREPAYPGWAPQPSSPLLELTRRKLGEICGGREPSVLAIHAGLECGILLEKCPTLKEAVSFGPTITGAHSPDEALEVATVKPFFDTLMAVLAELATAKA